MAKTGREGQVQRWVIKGQALLMKFPRLLQPTGIKKGTCHPPVRLDKLNRFAGFASNGQDLFRQLFMRFLLPRKAVIAAKPVQCCEEGRHLIQTLT